MTQNPDYLFVYGTLQPGFVNSFAQFLSQNSQLVGGATFPGVLFDLGGYPGALYQVDAQTMIRGTVYNISAKKSAILYQLDEYESIGVEYPLPHEYVRTIVPVQLNNVRVDCWIYLFNWPTDNKLVIASGDYVIYCQNQ